MLLQKTPADEFTATTKLSFCSRNSDQYVGLVCMSAEYSSVGLQRTEDGYELQIRHNPNAMRTHLTDEVLTVDTLKPTQKGTPRKGTSCGDAYKGCVPTYEYKRQQGELCLQH